jgi:hydrogenase maturation protease
MEVGTRVRLKPRNGGDVFDLVLAGKTAVVDAVEEDMEGHVLIGVLVDDDPGRDMGERGHRFFFTPAEVEPLPARILVAGIGNVFLGDDGWGVALAERLAARVWPDGVDLVDFGIRGMDLAYALAEYDVAVLLDAVPRGQPPGTVYLIEPDLEDLPPDVDAHGMDPVKVLALARALDSPLPRTFVLGCEPGPVDEDEIVASLSAPAIAALDEAERVFASLLDDVGKERL